MPGVDLEHLIRTVGYVGMFCIIFAETGLLIGFFLPGDSLLFTAGFLASQDYLNIWILVPICFIAAIVGDAVGYQIGSRFGRQLFSREESRFFKPKYLKQAQAFFDLHGGKAIILGRFMPIVRTFVPVIAGAATMQYRRFAIFNIAGGALWAIGVTVAGYFLGKTIPSVDKYLLPIIVLILVVSLAPSAIHVWRENGDEIKAYVRKRLNRA
ncbi:MAG: DedA family protein [Thermomicrobiales bacterium]